MTVTDAQFNSLANDMDTMWLMIGAILVFFMQTGFCMLEAGSVHIKNTKNILIKNLGDACIGAVCWWLIGHGLAFGESESRLFGTNGYALKGDVFESDDGTLTNGKAYAFSGHFLPLRQLFVQVPWPKEFLSLPMLSMQLF